MALGLSNSLGFTVHPAVAELPLCWTLSLQQIIQLPGTMRQAPSRAYHHNHSMCYFDNEGYFAV